MTCKFDVLVSPHQRWHSGQSHHCELVDGALDSEDP